MSYNVRNDRIEKVMRQIADSIKKVLPPNWGFTLLLFNYGENKEQTDGLFYISTAEREDIIKTMQEFIDRNKH